jgi:hypothetical protein
MIWLKLELVKIKKGGNSRKIGNHCQNKLNDVAGIMLDFGLNLVGNFLKE